MITNPQLKIVTQSIEKLEVKVKELINKEKSVDELLGLYDSLSRLDDLLYILQATFCPDFVYHNKVRDELWISAVVAFQVADPSNLTFTDSRQVQIFESIKWKVINRRNIETTKKDNRRVPLAYQAEFLRPGLGLDYPFLFDWGLHLYKNRNNPILKESIDNFSVEIYTRNVGLQHHLMDHLEIYVNNTPGVSFDIAWPPRKEQRLELLYKTYDIPNDLEQFINTNIIDTYIKKFHDKRLGYIDLFGDTDNNDRVYFSFDKIGVLHDDLLAELANTKLTFDANLLQNIVFVPVYFDKNEDVDVKIIDTDSRLLCFLPIYEGKFDLSQYLSSLSSIFTKNEHSLIKYIEDTYCSFNTQQKEHKDFLSKTPKLIKKYKIHNRKFQTNGGLFLKAIAFQLLILIIASKDLGVEKIKLKNSIFDYIDVIEKRLGAYDLPTICLVSLFAFDIDEFLESIRDFS